jgi:phage terminase large subunit-like protein
MAYSAKRKPKRAEQSKRAERVIEFIETFLRVPDGQDVGKPVRLREWQKKRLRKIYGSPTRQCIWSMAKKNGKTALIAMILLTHLVGPEARLNVQIRSAAQSREQAAVVFKYAAQMIRMSREISDMIVVRDSAKELFCPTTGVHYKALSAEAKTAHGQSPALLIHDELGEVVGPRSDLYSALEQSMGAHEHPMSLIISTQAASDGDLLSTLIDSALASNDPTIKVFLDAAPQDADPWVEKTWKLANPALGDFLSIDEFRGLARAAKRLPAQEAKFRNYNLNQRVSAEEHFLSKSVWELNAGESDLSVMDDCEVFVAADLSATRDLTALIAGGKDSDGVWHIRPWFFLPEQGLVERAAHDRVPYDLWRDQGLITTTPGRSVNYDDVAAIVAPALRNLNVRGFAFDRWQFEVLRQAFARIGWEPPFLEDFGQGFKTMSPALRALETVALEGKLRHGNNPVLRMCAENARVTTDDAGNRKLTKRRSTGRIDGMVALAMLIGAASGATPPDEDSVYETRGLLFV